MAFALHDLESVGRLLADAADAEIMPRFGTLSRDRIRAKTSALDLVTEADEAAERVIHAGLAAAFPGALIVGEEATHCRPALLDSLDGADLAFVVDPIDGTRNFAAHVPLFGVMVAAIVRGEVVAGAIYDPVCRDWAYALRGEGAWRAGVDGVRADLRVAAPVAVAAMDAVVGTNYLPEPLRATVNGNLSKLGLSSWLRCAAHEYRLAAGGHCHLLFYNKLMPWDHAAGWLLHREAGGFSAHFDGTAYRPAHRTGGLICAPDQDSWRAARDALLGADG